MSAIEVAQLRVVIADDAEPLRALVTHRLGLDGRFEVVAQAADGEAAVALTLSHKPDVVLLDLSMPGIDGLEALRRIRASAPDSKVVVLSGFRAGELAPDALALGAAAYIEKGVELDRLTAVLADVCGMGTQPPAVLTRSSAATRPRSFTGPEPVGPATDEPTADRDPDSGARVPLLAFLTLVILTVVVLTVTQATARQRLLSSFETRTAATAAAVALGVEALVEHTADAVAPLAGTPTTTRDLQLLTAATGASAAVHVAADGTVLTSVGEVPDELPKHVTGALAGTATVAEAPGPSPEAPGVGIGVPVGDGTVVGVAFTADDEELTITLSNSLPRKASMGWVFDGAGHVLAEVVAEVDGWTELATPPTAAAAWAGDEVVAWTTRRAPVDGTDWTVVTAATDAHVYEDIDGTMSALPWVLVALLASAGVVALGLAERDRRNVRRLEGVNAELATSNEDLEQFAYVASHDLQEPLRKVASYCQLLERRYGDELGDDAKQYIAYAVDGATRMQQLIADLLRFSRAGRPDRTMIEPVDVIDALERVRDSLAAHAGELDAVVTIPTSAPPVLADEAQLRQVLQNLLTNALKFTADDRQPVVEVSAYREGSMIHLAVRDNGIGIDPEHHERVFGVFQRLHGREEYDGTGIGLAICRRMVQRMGGRIWVSSAAGYGATFHVLLPAVDRETVV